MPLFLCRWPNGDCSVVWARNRDDAVVQLDRVGNAEGCPLVPLRTFQIHFVLTERGELALEGFGEGTSEDILARMYPLLDQIRHEVYGDGEYDGYESLPPERRAAITRGVARERTWIELDETHTTEPQTEMGRDIKSQTDLPTIVVDRLVRQVATTRLKGFKGHRKPS